MHAQMQPRWDRTTQSKLSVEDPFNLSKKYWVGIRFNEDMPDDKIKAYVKQSYDLVASSQKNKLVK